MITLEDLSLSLRPIIKAPEGKKLVIADFSSIENRVLFWLAGCEAGMQIYRDGRDPYIDFASRLWDLPYEDVSKELRQQAKPGNLGCGFGLGGGQLIRFVTCKRSLFDTEHKRCERRTIRAEQRPPERCVCGAGVEVSPPTKTGLWRYAELLGVDMTQEDAHKQVGVFRDAFTEVCELWYYLEKAFIACAGTRRDQKVSKLRFHYADPALRIILPSGRELVYMNPFGKESRYGAGETVLGFEGVKGNAWCRQTTYGGRLCENVVQAIAYDLLADALERVDADAAFELIGHVHDEIITLTDRDAEGMVKHLEGLMSKLEPWADGLIMKAEGFECLRYLKG